MNNTPNSTPEPEALREGRKGGQELKKIGCVQHDCDACKARRSARRFPMQRGPSIPWSLAKVIYAGYTALYGDRQSLERIAERGGFSWREVEVLYNDPGLGHIAKQAMDAAIAEVTGGSQ